MGRSRAKRLNSSPWRQGGRARHWACCYCGVPPSSVVVPAEFLSLPSSLCCSRGWSWCGLLLRSGQQDLRESTCCSFSPAAVPLHRGVRFVGTRQGLLLRASLPVRQTQRAPASSCSPVAALLCRDATAESTPGRRRFPRSDFLRLQHLCVPIGHHALPAALALPTHGWPRCLRRRSHC